MESEQLIRNNLFVSLSLSFVIFDSDFLILKGCPKQQLRNKFFERTRQEIDTDIYDLMIGSVLKSNHQTFFVIHYFVTPNNWGFQNFSNSQVMYH